MLVLLLCVTNMVLHDLRSEFNLKVWVIFRRKTVCRLNFSDIRSSLAGMLLCSIYLFGFYIRYSLIPTIWSFGQIIAVAVWIPSLVEYAYIKYCKSVPSTLASVTDQYRRHRGSL